MDALLERDGMVVQLAAEVADGALERATSGSTTERTATTRGDGPGAARPADGRTGARAPEVARGGGRSRSCAQRGRSPRT